MVTENSKLSLEYIESEWEKDAEVDMTNLGYESARNPLLHSKYVKMLSKAKLLVRKAESDYLRLRKDKYRYFKGEMTQEELRERQWPQYLGRTPLKTEMEEYLTTDNQMIQLTDKLEYLKTIQSTLEMIMKAIANRGWELRSAIEWVKIQNGLI